MAATLSQLVALLALVCAVAASAAPSYSADASFSPQQQLACDPLDFNKPESVEYMSCTLVAQARKRSVRPAGAGRADGRASCTQRRSDACMGADAAGRGRFAVAGPDADHGACIDIDSMPANGSHVFTSGVPARAASGGAATCVGDTRVCVTRPRTVRRSPRAGVPVQSRHAESRARRRAHREPRRPAHAPHVLDEGCQREARAPP
jgi:hypothetical protein